MLQLARFGTVVIALLIATPAFAQGPVAASDGHKVLNHDVGTWHADGKMYMPEQDEPFPFEGEEVNEMLGNLHLVSRFSGNFGGMEFRGHGTASFDPESKMYTGIWMDNMNPHMMLMEGKYDPETKTMTQFTTGKLADGTENKGKSVLVYKDEDTRMLTMYRAGEGDEWIKEMEILYTRK